MTNTRSIEGEVRVPRQLGPFRIGEQHPRLGVVADLGHFARAEAGIDGCQRDPGLGRSRHDLQVLDAVPGQDSPVRPRLELQPVEHPRADPVDTGNQVAVSSLLPAMAHGDLSGIAAHGRPDAAGHGQGPVRRRNIRAFFRTGHSEGSRKTLSALSRSRHCFDSGLRSSWLTSATARSGSMTGQSVPNMTLPRPYEFR